MLEGYAEGLGRRVRLTPAEREIVDPAAVASLLDPAPLPKRAAGAATRMQAQLPVALANVRPARDAGVLVVAGSDAGTIGTLHGPAVLRELELLVVVLDASPLADVRNLARVRVVVKDGVPHTPEEILAPTPGERARRQENAARLRE